MKTTIWDILLIIVFIIGIIGGNILITILVITGEADPINLLCLVITTIVFITYYKYRKSHPGY